MTPIAQWLRDARLRQTNPDTGRPWSQEFLVDRVRAETGWTLHRPNYVGYERGAGMEPDTLQRFIDFWHKYGVEAPDLTEKPAPLSLEERAVVAAERQADAAEAMVAEQRRSNGLLAALLTVRSERLAPEEQEQLAEFLLVHGQASPLHEPSQRG